MVMAAALEGVRTAGAVEVRAEVTDGNTPSEKLMARFGFVALGPA